MNDRKEVLLALYQDGQARLSAIIALREDLAREADALQASQRRLARRMADAQEEEGKEGTPDYPWPDHHGQARAPVQQGGRHED